MSYRELQEHFRRLGQIDEVLAVVEWDQAVNMPQSAGESRAESMAGLARLRHELLVDGRVGAWLQSADVGRELPSWESANLREMRRAYQRATAIPGALVEASAHADKRSEQAWRRYRSENDFASYAPYLQQVVSLKIEVAEAVASVLGCSPYEALVDEFESGVSASQIDEVFDPLERFIPTFTEQVIEAQKSVSLVVPVGPFPVDSQRALGLKMMQAVGFDLSRGRLDVSHHPFCGGVPQDVRITTRYDESDFTPALMGVLHEAGHGKYEQGLPVAWRHQPVGLARGMALHESQSLLLEMQVCRSPQFLAFALPSIREAFAPSVQRQPAAFTLSNLVSLYSRVQRSLIRVDADEVTYPAHVLLRYDLEKRLIGRDLSVKDLPEAWDERMQTLLHLRTAGDDRNGCMQDVHWPSGAFGYFPLYTLGAVAAAQLFASAKAEHPEILSQLEVGDFSQLSSWLNERVWKWGSLRSSKELMVKATGTPLRAERFIEHLKTRYLPASE